MTHLPSLPEQARLLDVLRAYPDTARPLLDYHETLMRGPTRRRSSLCPVQPHEPLRRGLGVSADESYFELSGRRLAEGGCTGLKQLL